MNTSAPMNTTLSITGMTCGHCERAVTSELTALAGVTSVDVTIVKDGTSAVRVTSDGPLAEPALRAAVDEAGYDLVAVTSDDAPTAADQGAGGGCCGGCGCGGKGRQQRDDELPIVAA